MEHITKKTERVDYVVHSDKYFFEAVPYKGDDNFITQMKVEEIELEEFRTKANIEAYIRGIQDIQDIQDSVKMPTIFVAYDSFTNMWFEMDGARPSNIVSIQSLIDSQSQPSIDSQSQPLIKTTVGAHVDGTDLEVPVPVEPDLQCEMNFNSTDVINACNPEAKTTQVFIPWLNSLYEVEMHAMGDETLKNIHVTKSNSKSIIIRYNGTFWILQHNSEYSVIVGVYTRDKENVVVGCCRKVATGWEPMV
jgi:hypothetical protein